MDDLLGDCEIGEVVIDYRPGEDYDHKYILTKVSSGQNDRVVLVSKKLRYHSRITDAYTRQIASHESVTVHGGGILKIEPKAKKISTYGTSGGYGDPNKDIVEAILQAFVKDYYPGWELDVKVTPYVRD